MRLALEARSFIVGRLFSSCIDGSGKSYMINCGRAKGGKSKGGDI